jgi:hypothetical protein
VKADQAIRSAARQLPGSQYMVLLVFCAFRHAKEGGPSLNVCSIK